MCCFIEMGSELKSCDWCRSYVMLFISFFWQVSPFSLSLSLAFLQPHWSNYHLAGSSQGLTPDEPGRPHQLLAGPAAEPYEPSKWCVLHVYVWLWRRRMTCTATCFSVFEQLCSWSDGHLLSLSMQQNSGAVELLHVATRWTSVLAVQLEFARGEVRLRRNVTCLTWHGWELCDLQIRVY